MGFIDSHIHTIFLSWGELLDLAYSGYEAVITVAYTPYVPRSKESLADHFEHLLLEVDRLKSVGLRAFVGVGIHPRCFRPGLIGEYMEVLKEYLPKADVLGEVGLESCSDVEVELLKKQLELAKELGKPVILHTPRTNKVVALKAALRAIKEVEIPEEVVVIDHLTLSEEVINLVKDKSTYLGFTIQQGKSSTHDITYLIEKHEELIDRVVLNSDAGRDPSDTLAVAKAYEELAKEGYGVEAVKVTSVNIKKLLK